MAESVDPKLGSAERIRIPLAVYFDTSSLIAMDRRLEDPSLSALLAIRSQMKFDLVVPEIVITEYVARQVRGDRAKIGKANNILRHLRGFHEVDVADVEVNDDRLRASIADRLTQRLADLGANVAPTPEIPLETLVAESVMWEPPFAEGDRGFRDAVIHEAIVAHARDGWRDPFIIVVTEESRWKEATPRFTSRGIDVEFVSLKDAPKRIEVFLSEAGRRWFEKEMERAIAFARENQDAIFEAALETECDMWTLRHVPGGGDDPLANRTIHRIRSATPKQIAIASTFAADGRDLASDRVAFDVFVDVEFELETSFWRGGTSLFGPSFKIDTPVDIGALAKQEPMYEEWEVVGVTRKVGVRGSIDRVAYEASRFDDFRVESDT